MTKMNLETLKEKYFESGSVASFGHWITLEFSLKFTAQDIDVLKSCVNMKQATRYLLEKGYAE